MTVIDWEKTVDPNYRNRILTDQDNPVLAFKANRDRYTSAKNQQQYTGMPQIGSIYSEDTLTWNIFRTLQMQGLISLLGNALEAPKLELSQPKLLIWGLSCGLDAGELQYEVGSYIRSIDGKHNGQITEPDVVILTNKYLIFIECKLGKPHIKPNHLWEGSGSGPDLRYNDYFSVAHPFKSHLDGELYKEAYQLVRMGFYCYSIGNRLRRQPILLSLSNHLNWYKGKRSAEQIWQDFTGYVDDNKLTLASLHWQDITEHVSTIPALYDYLRSHPCLNK